jgi:hypothetical protein
MKLFTIQIGTKHMVLKMTDNNSINLLLQKNNGWRTGRRNSARKN